MTVPNSVITVNSKYTRIKGKRKKKKNFINKLVEQQKCNICKLKKYRKYYQKKYSIANYDMDDFLTNLILIEKEVINDMEGNKCYFFRVNYYFHQNLRSYFSKKSEKNFISLNVIEKHLTSCLYKNLQNGRIKRFKNFDQIVEMGLTPTFVYEIDPETDQLGFNHENIRSLERIQKMKDIELNEYLKLTKTK